MSGLVGSQAAATLTFLFTDIEGSTRLWEKSADVMRQALVRHDALAGEIVARCNGRIVKSRGEGDSLFAVFSDARDGVMAACALQAAFHSEPWAGGWTIRARMALHRGSAEIRDEDYYGPTINRCARLRAIGHGGQILISQSAFDALHTPLPDGFDLRDMGRHRLKDLQQPEQVYQVCPPELPREFAPLLSLNYVQHNLPIQTTSFVGRDRELADIRALLQDTAALTLVGTGGSGKSRLALQAAADRIDHAVDGVWIVDLAPVTEPDLVVQTVATVLGLREEPGQPLLRTLCAYLKTRSTLLLLDSCEHVVAACASLAEAVLRACPNARILATSRERLGVEGEHVYPVPTLPLPPADSGAATSGATEPAVLLEYASVRLFCERALLQQPGFTLTVANAGAVTEICRKLDGIPLALELAAARIRSLPPAQILSRLDDRFRILKGGSRTAMPRQQTLEALIDWSYDLLTPPEKALLQGLTVFAGGWTLEAAEEICDLSPTAEAGGIDGADYGDVLDCLTSLVDKSLVVFSGENEYGRYRLLETIRHYATLKRSGDAGFAQVESRHTEFFLKFAREAEPHLQGPSQAEWLDRLEQEHDNLRAALGRCLAEEPSKSRERTRIALAFCGALWWFWLVRGHLKEGHAWLIRALSVNPEPDEARAVGLTGLGMLALHGNDLQTAEKSHNEALIIRRATGNRRGIAVSLTNLGNAALELKELERARELFEECITLWEELGESETLARAWNNLGGVVRMQGDLSAARSLFQRSLDCLRAGGDARSVALLLYNLAEVAFDEKDYTAAEANLMECLSVIDNVEDRYVHAYAVHMLGSLAYATGRDSAALLLWGASQAVFEKIGAALKPGENQALEEALLALRERFGEARFTELWQTGRVTPLSATAAILRDAPSLA